MDCPTSKRRVFKAMVSSLGSTARRGSLCTVLVSAAAAWVLADMSRPVLAAAPQVVPGARPTSLLQPVQHALSRSDKAPPRYYAPPTAPPSSYSRWNSPRPPAYFTLPPPSQWSARPTPSLPPSLSYDRD